MPKLDTVMSNDTITDKMQTNEHTNNTVCCQMVVGRDVVFLLSVTDPCRFKRRKNTIEGGAGSETDENQVTYKNVLYFWT